ncbi:unnamed protein product [Arabidopsis arenosa]|uniref:S-adenosylmethionine-dependent methyltransferase n=1 Tax=Arabidopsis arenosa TaxID=38785 RepID=A0A8S2B001_ARAAE|nr:unnamed protein product [Arabidopsis arenosa]
MPTFPQSFPMNGGDGPHSYIHNSSYQKVAIDGAKERTREAILEKLDLELLNRNSESSILRIADFGCSIGPNTFDVVQNIIDTESPALNKSYIQCNNLVDEVTKAYKIQFKKDIGGFLEARAEELVSGGLMILSGQCLPDGIPKALTWQGVVIDMIGDCLMDMAKLGITSKEKIELFSLPTYIPHISEFKANIEQNENFTIETMEEISHPMDYMPLTNDFITSMFRAILNTIIEKHFGDGVVDELFDRLAKKLDKYPINFRRCKKYVNYFIVLKRK